MINKKAHKILKVYICFEYGQRQQKDISGSHLRTTLLSLLIFEELSQ